MATPANLLTALADPNLRLRLSGGPQSAQQQAQPQNALLETFKAIAADPQLQQLLTVQAAQVPQQGKLSKGQKIATGILSALFPAQGLQFKAARSQQRQNIATQQAAENARAREATAGNFRSLLGPVLTEGLKRQTLAQGGDPLVRRQAINKVQQLGTDFGPRDIQTIPTSEILTANTVQSRKVRTDRELGLQQRANKILERQEQRQVEDLASRYGQAGGFDANASLSEALAKSGPLIESARLRDVRADEAAIAQRDLSIAEKTGRFTAIEAQANVAANVITGMEPVLAQLGRLGLHDEADTLQFQISTVRDAVLSGRADPTPSSVAILKNEVTELRRQAKDAKVRSDKAGALITPDTTADLSKMFDTILLTDFLIEKMQQTNFGGPVSGSAFARAFPRGEEFRQVETAFGHLLGMTAFSEGGKNLTGMELGVVQPKLPRLNQFGEKIRQNLNFTRAFMIKALKAASNRTGLDMDELRRISGSTDDLNTLLKTGSTVFGQEVELGDI